MDPGVAFRGDASLGQLDLLEASRSSFLMELEGIFELSTWVKSFWLANTQHSPKLFNSWLYTC